MIALATLLVIAVFAYAIYRFAPRTDEESFRLDRFRPPGPLADWTPAHREDQRRYSDLAAIYGRNDVPDPDAPAVKRPERVPQPRIADPSCGAVKPSRIGIQASFS
jgi:hypothetical protein